MRKNTDDLNCTNCFVNCTNCFVLIGIEGMLHSKIVEAVLYLQMDNLARQDMCYTTKNT